MRFIFSFFLFHVLCQHSLAQSPQIRNLIFEGAGIRGIAYAGVISEFEKAGMTDSLEKVGGTSAGAITALALALGYSAGEIETIIGHTEFQKFNSGRLLFFGGFHRMRKRYGWYRGDKFNAWLEDLIAAKTGDPDITFDGMHRRGFKDLYVTGVCLNRQKLVVFSRQTYPAMKVRDAARISMSVPLYFEAVFTDSLGNVFSKPAKDLDIMIDCGVLGNFPIRIFDSIATVDGREIRIPNVATLGVRIDSDEQIASDLNSRELAPFEIDDLRDYTQAFYVLILENLNRAELTEDDWERTISVSSAGVGPRVRRLSEKQKNDLVESGRRGAGEFISDKQ